MKAVLTALLLSLLTLSAGAQGGDEFCDGIEKIIAASPVRFLDLQDAYELPGVGVGKDAVTLGAYSCWASKRTFAKKEDALADYQAIAARLEGCRIDGASLSYKETDAAELKKKQWTMEGKWTFPKGHEHEEISIAVFVYRHEGAFLRTFHLYNSDGSNQKLYMDRIMERMPFGAPSSDKSGSADACALLNRVLESGTGFSGMQGTLKSTQKTTFPPGISQSFTSKESPEGMTSIISTSNTGASWAAELESADEADLTRRFNALKSAINGCTFSVATFRMTGEDEKITIWFPRSVRPDLGLNPDELSITLHILPTSRGTRVLQLVMRRSK